MFPLDPVDAFFDDDDLPDMWDELAALTAHAKLRQSAKSCRTCGQLILWRNVRGRKISYNLDWHPHVCPPEAIAAVRERRRKAALIEQELEMGLQRGLESAD